MLVEVYSRYAHLPCVIQARVIEDVVKACPRVHPHRS